MASCCCQNCAAKLLLKNEKFFTIFTEQSKKICRGNELGLVCLNHTAFFLSNEPDTKLLVVSAGSCMKNSTLRLLFHAQSLNLSE